MTSNKKSFVKGAVAIACMLSICGSAMPATMPVKAVEPAKADVFVSADNNSAVGNYYYDNLKISNKEYELGKKFYDMLDGMRVSGDFKDGKISQSIDNIVTSAQLKAWVEDGDLTVPKAFGAARDSFLMDHPELFYIDVYKIMISAGYSGGKYTGYIDSGREANIYRDDAFTTEAEVNAAVAKYDAAVKKFADDAAAKMSEIGSAYKDDYKLAMAANNEIASKVEYDYSVYNDYMENGDNAASISSLAHTAYGALVNKKAVCSGYSFGYKAVMDSLGIPCVVVSGYSTGKDRTGNSTGGNVAHSWNYVKLQIAGKNDASQSGAQASASADGDVKNVYDWFAFDTTWNGVSTNRNKYSAMDSETASEEHMPESIVSSSNYPLNYPSLSQVSYDIASTVGGGDISVDGFTYRRGVGENDSNEYVSYNGKNAMQLFETENLRMAVRFYAININGATDGQKAWTDWTDIVNANNKYEGMAYPSVGKETTIGLAYNAEKTQYAVIENLEPDKDNTTPNGIVLYEKAFYGDADKVRQHAKFLSDEFENGSYGTYTPPPYIIASRSYPISGTDVTINSNMSEPGNSNLMADSKAINVKLVYDEPLHVLDDSKDIKVVVTAKKESALQYSGFAKFADGKEVHLSKDENGVLNTIEFKFKPSLMFEHNRVGYTFSFENVGSAKIVEKKNEDGELVKTTSDIAPNTAYYVFSRLIYACPKVFGDGRLYIDCCAQPTLVDNSDLAATGFLDEDGNPTFSESARSQMMLVVNDVRPETENKIKSEIAASDNGISESDIIKSQTYDINLQMCGKIAKIPDKSYVRLALGFPEGYGPDDEGVSFKIFHRKHIGGNQYEIEEIPCVVTKFGIVVTVNSFSPYTVAVVPKAKATGKTIAASIDGKGGTLSRDDGRVRAIAEGGSYTYTLTPNEGYRLYKVLLNGKDVTDKVADNKLKVEYADLGTNNELEIKYIAGDAVARYEANNIVDPVKIVIPVGTDIFGGGAVQGAPVKSSNVGLIVGLTVLGVVLVAGGVAAFLIVKKKKSTPETETAASTSAQKKNVNSAQTAARPVQNRPQSTAQNGARPASQTTQQSRPTQNSATRPTNTAARPTQQSRPAQNSAARPAQRPTTANRPMQQNGTRQAPPKNNDKK